MIYLDSSAVAKLVHEEPESGDLESWLSRDERPLVTSLLTEVEVERTLRRSEPDALPLVSEIIDGLYRFEIDMAVRQVAARFAEPTLRTLDAIHLATALEFGADLGALACYDRRLLAAATALGVPVASPGSR
ncbi:MAG: type II toxin-antitoxin system VapC family toxin [Actinomycetota bacterium]|nr:type II toxin-antitoxin system VapC family toxin [Actinomycetota bacterium]